MSKWSGLDDEAMTRETQTPGWSGTEQECCLDGGGADVISEIIYLYRIFTALKYNILHQCI